MKRSLLPVLVLAFLGTVFCAAGFVVGFVFGKPLLDKARASETWPTTEGVITHSELVSHRDKDGTTWSADIVYEYTLDGGQLTCDRVWFGDGYSTSNRKEMAEVVRKYPVGKKVTVYYSPDDPAVAVLEPGAFTSSSLMFILGIVFLVVGAILYLAMAAVLIFRARARLNTARRAFAERNVASRDDFGSPDRPFSDELDSFSNS